MLNCDFSFISIMILERSNEQVNHPRNFVRLDGFLETGD
jgi:hypothetical protein